jgi:hypothetical protein
LLVDSSNDVALISAWVLIKPRPATPYGCTMPNFGAIITLPIRVRTFEDVPGVSPKKLSMNENSSSAPMTLPIEPKDTPRLRVLFSQFEISGHPASPPKL